MIYYKKVRILQVFLSIIFLIILLLLNFLLNKYGLPVNPKHMLYLSNGLFFIIISYFYILIGLQFKVNKTILKHKCWSKLPFVTLCVSSLLFIIFIISYNTFSVTSKVESFLILIGIVFFVLLYFVFILSLLNMFNKNKEKVIHYTYLWALIPLVILLILFLIN